MRRARAGPCQMIFRSGSVKFYNFGAFRPVCSITVSELLNVLNVIKFSIVYFFSLIHVHLKQTSFKVTNM